MFLSPLPRATVLRVPRATVLRTSIFFCLWLLATAGLAAVSPPPPALTITFTDGFLAVSQLTIGDDLWVQVENGPEDSFGELVLKTEVGETIVSKRIAFDQHGVSEPALLWFRSGVVGCGDETWVDPSVHRFVDFQEAEVQLDQRTFEVQVLGENGAVLGFRRLALAQIDKPRYFFSDVNGCPRSVFDDNESVYLSAIGAQPETQETGIYLVDRAAPVTSQGFINEVRSFYFDFPQVLGMSEGHGSWTRRLWKGKASVPGHYGAFVCIATQQNRVAETCTHSVGAKSDDPKAEHGITVRDWSTNQSDEADDTQSEDL